MGCPECESAWAENAWLLNDNTELQKKIAVLEEQLEALRPKIEVME